MNYDYLDKEQIINILNDTLECVDKQRKEIEKLHSIIKEVREYIKENYPTSTINYQEDKYKLLEILDKVEENK